MQTAQPHAIAVASETAGSLVFQPRERPPTQLHQAPSPLQRCAPSRLSTISGAAEPKSLSRPASSSLDRPQSPLSEPADHLIPNPIDQNPWAHWRSPMDMMRQGWSTSLFHETVRTAGVEAQHPVPDDLKSD